MRFPSLRSLAAQAGAAALRFPLPLLAAAAATACAIWSIDSTRTEEMPMRGLQTALLGLPLLLAVTLLHERSAGDPRARRWRVLVLAAALAALGAYFLAWPSFTWNGGWIRFLHLAVACHLLVAFLPFVGPAQLASFWSFNRSLFLRFLLSALFAAVLYGGTTVALLGLDRLFELGLDAKPYLRLALLATLLFHPWHFLAGVPRLVASPDAVDLPVALRVFAQFVLVPLVALYLLILNGYVVRLLVLQHWPVRFLGLLVAAVAIAGWLALLLLFPLRPKPEYRWLDWFERAFHVLVLPPAIVLLIAIGRRVAKHGLTEPRYLLAMLALWLIGLSLFHLVTQQRNIKLVPSSLALLALFTFGGPWSASAASRWEQRGRLAALLEDAAMLEGERARTPPKPLDFETRRALSGTVTYLLAAHGDEALAPWLDARASAHREPSLVLQKGASVEPLARRVLEDVGVGYVDRWTASTPSTTRLLNRFASPDSEPLDVSASTLRPNHGLTVAPEP
ncbi:MAG TPA: DUF4153 domain-containing protein [Thermoanaerobaculia bacterium]|nr:DUF4153 domain-containing protein [Thermoanaerobaculia bacterium]